MSAPRGPGRDLSALKKSSGLRALRPNGALVEQGPAPAGPSPGLAESDQHEEELAEALPPQAHRAPSRAVGRDPGQDGAVAGGKRGTIAYLPAEVKARLEAAARAAAQTYTEWFLDQFDALYDQLAEEFPPPPQRRSPLPARARSPRRRVGLGPSTMLQLRLTSEELLAIDERRAQLSGPSRSEFVTRIIELGIERST